MKKTNNDEPILSQEAQKLLKLVRRKPLSLYYGRGKWNPIRLPNGVKRKHFDELYNSDMVTVKNDELVCTCNLKKI